MTNDPPVKIPRVSRGPTRPRVAPLAIGLALVGTGVFASLASNREARELRSSALPPLRMRAAATSVPLTDPVPASATVPMPMPMPMPGPMPAAGASSAPMTMPLAPARPDPATLMPGMPMAGHAPAAALPPATGSSLRTRIAAPALVVDLAQARTGMTATGMPVAVMSDSGAAAPATAPTGDPTGAAIAAAGGSAAQSSAAPADPGRDLNGDERFAVRAGSRDVATSVASRLRNQHRLIAQGTIIGAVMETALNSDLPGYAKALVSRDVLSFDGSQVLIPAGSHVIGEYKSGVAQGASRIFIVWSRLIRPDGVSVSLASPAVDDLGRGGLGGSVNRHFFQRFGGAILTSVLSGGLNVLASSVRNGSTVVVSNSSEANSLANQASRGTDIPPTIKTRNGAAVRIFVARDLDFSGV